MKKTLGTKILSVVLSALMCFGVFAVLGGVPAAEAKTAGQYSYRVIIDVSDDADQECISFTLYGKNNNGTGTETVMGTETWKDKSVGTGVTEIFSGTSNYFPTRLHLESGEKYWFDHTFEGTFSIIIGGTTYLYLNGVLNSSSDTNVEVGSGTSARFYWDKKIAGNVNRFNIDYSVASTYYPYPSTLTLTGGDESIIAPAVGGSSVQTSNYSADVKDQYGVTWGKTATQWSVGSITGCALSMTSSTGDTSKVSVPAFTVDSTRKTVAVTASATYGGHTASEYLNLLVYPKYKVSYDANGGVISSDAILSETITNTTNITTINSYNIPSQNRATRTGYQFAGWNSDRTAGTGSLGTASVGHDTTLYGIWTPNVYYVNFYGNGSTSGTMSRLGFTYDVTQALTANRFARGNFKVNYRTNGGTLCNQYTANSTFLGWAKTANGAVSFSDGQSVRNLSEYNGATYDLYAKWQDEVITLPSTTKANYAFGGWYYDEALTNKAGDPGDTVTVSETMMLYAKWDCLHATFNSEVYEEPGCETQGKTIYTCPDCGYYYFEPIAPINHNYGSFTYDGVAAKTHTKVCANDASHKITENCSFTSAVTKAASCSETGIRTYTCETCGGTYTETIAKLEHTPGEVQIENSTASSCTVPGTYEEVVYCSVCTAELSRTQKQKDVASHIAEIIPAVTATCSVEGFTSGSKCSVCGEILSAPESLGYEPHIAEVIIGKPATCMESGLSDGSKCSVCKKILEEQTVIPSKGHNPGEPQQENITPSTCIRAGGYNLRTYCLDCSERISNKYISLPLADHTPVEIPAVTATCEVMGMTAGSKCKVCGYIIDAPTETGYAEHTPELRNVRAASCTANGYTGDYVCTVCGTVTAYGTQTAKLDHDMRTIPGFASTCSAHGYTDSYECIECGYVEIPHSELPFAAHTPGAAVRTNEKAATCADEGSYDEVVSCIDCTAEISRTTKYTGYAEHTRGEKVIQNVKAATCTKNGSYEEAYFCTYCKKLISKTTVTTEKAPHKAGGEVRENVVNGNCTTKGHYDAVVYCTECGAEMSRKTVTTSTGTHTPGGETRENVTPATCTQTGAYEAVVRCTVCGTEISRTIKTTGKANHSDGNGDGLCDDCGENLAASCSHLCHKTGFMGFIWTIVNLFNKLFKINQYCSCGARHW